MSDNDPKYVPETESENEDLQTAPIPMPVNRFRNAEHHPTRKDELNVESEDEKDNDDDPDYVPHQGSMSSEKDDVQIPKIFSTMSQITVMCTANTDGKRSWDKPFYCPFCFDFLLFDFTKK